MKKVFFSIGLVYYSGEGDLKECIESLLKQKEQEFEILFRDNSEKSAGKKFVEKYFSIEIAAKKIQIFTGKNLWHSGGHNFLVSNMQGKNYVCGSIDMKYEKKFLKNLKDEIKNNNDFSVFTGKILQWGSENILDSAGIQKNFFERCTDRGQGKDEKEFQNQEQVFGSSGALFAIRKKDIPSEGLFDERIFYKNDVDLMYRLQKEKKKCLFIPKVFAWHHRQVGKNSKKSLFIKQSSFEGQYWTWKKNFPKNFFGRIFVGAQFIRLFFTSPVKAMESYRKI